MKIRLFARGSRPAFILGRKGADGRFERRWIVLHRRPPSWEEIFREALDLLALEIDSNSDAELDFGGGKIRWQSHQKYTKVILSFTKYSPRKQQLLADACYKASRYAISPIDHADPDPGHHD